MVIFFDIDGTIVDDETQIIPDSTVRAVKRLRENGHIPVINTGRPYSHIDPRVRAIPFSGWICGCGMEIWLNDQRIYFAETSPEICLLVRDAVRQCGMRALYEAEDGALVSDGIYSEHPLCTGERALMKKKRFENREMSPVPKFMKFMSFEWPDCDREEFLRRLTPYFDAIDRGKGRLEFMIKGCSKARGMEILMERLGIPREDSLAVGDSTNDLPMFQAAGHSACMGDGMEELKAVAEYVTAPVLEDGIEKALRHFGLID